MSSEQKSAKMPAAAAAAPQRAPAAATAAASQPPATGGTAASGAGAEFNYRLPGESTMRNAAKLSIVEDKPIMMDYWTASLDKKALVGAKENNEKLLVKSEEEYTSTIQKFYKSGQEYIIITENSIYIVSLDIPTRKIAA